MKIRGKQARSSYDQRQFVTIVVVVLYAHIHPSIIAIYVCVSKGPKLLDKMTKSLHLFAITRNIHLLMLRDYHLIILIPKKKSPPNPWICQNSNVLTLLIPIYTIYYSCIESQLSHATSGFYVTKNCCIQIIALSTGWKIAIIQCMNLTLETQPH